MKKLKIGDKLRVTDKSSWGYNKVGTLVAIVKEYTVDGEKRYWRNEYIVQFRNPMEWSWYIRRQLKQEPK
jgi:hypothetical protein